MIHDTLVAARHLSENHAGTVLAVGLAGVMAYGAAKWRQDRALAFRIRGARRPTPPLAAMHEVSVLVAAWNEADMIDRHVQSVLALRYRRVQYVLCAGGTDGTFRLAERYRPAGAAVLEQRPDEGKQAALRRCLEHASGEIIFLTDADCLLGDDSFERTIGPIVRGEAEVTTGGSRPLAEQFGRSILATYRWSVDAYDAAHAPPESGGLLGRNVALTRCALEQAGAFGVAVPTGTDYHLARSLLATGYRIRRVSESEVATRYPEGIGAYARQQRRWLRNVVLLGLWFRSYRQVAGALAISVLGLGMLLAPAAARLVGSGALSVWLIALAHSVVSKIRYLAFGSLVSDELSGRNVAAAYVAAFPLTLVEFAIWAWPIADYLVPAWRRRW